MKVVVLTLIAPIVLATWWNPAWWKKDPAAGLNELPGQAAANLKLVRNLPLLATRIEPTTPRPPEPFSIVPPATKDATRTYFDAKITIPITVCTRAEARLANENNLLFPHGSGRTTFKLTNPRIFADLKDSVLAQPPLVCTVNNGPWSAQIVQERGCIGTTSPLNTLTVIGVPNIVLFVWFGDVNTPPPGFEFVERPVKTGDENLGPCHSGPAGAEQPSG